MPEFLNDFWAEVGAVWGMAFLGVNAGRVLTAFLILFFAYVLRRLFAHVLAVWLQKLTARTKTTLDDDIAKAIEKPLALAPIALRRACWLCQRPGWRFPIRSFAR